MVQQLGFVYRITNLRNQKSYIGETESISKRIKDHFRSPRNESFKEDVKSDPELVDFEVEVLEICFTVEDRKRLESFWISCFNSTDPSWGYNKKNGEGRKKQFKRGSTGRSPGCGSRAFMQTYKYKETMSERTRQQFRDPVTLEKMKRAAVAGWQKRRAKQNSKKACT